jgi:hypothetical protein
LTTMTENETEVFKKKWRRDVNQTPLSLKLASMKIGDTFVVTDDVQLTRVNVSAWSRRHHRKFSITRQGSVHVCERIRR